MRPIRTLIGLFIGLSIVGAIASAISAAVMKRRLVSEGAEPDNELSLVTIYTGRDFASMAPAFRGGSLLTWYGGCSIDFRGATLDPAGATLRIRTLFGGLRLIVPKTWRVENRIRPMFGGVGDARDLDGAPEDGPTLTLEGGAVFGGVGIFADAPDLDAARTSMDEAEPIVAASMEVPAPA